LTCLFEHLDRIQHWIRQLHHLSSLVFTSSCWVA